MSLFKRFLRFTIPSIISMWIFSLYTIVDGIFVAKGVGEQALAAVNLCVPYVSLIFTLGLILATGTSTVLALSMGEGDLERARNIFSQNLTVVAVGSVLFGGLTLLCLDGVAALLGATDSTLGYVREYVSVIAVFAVFFTVSYNLEVQVKTNGAPQVSAVGVLSCAIMNVLLDYVFVMRLGWGVRGAAVATGLAQVTSTIVFAVYFGRHREGLKLQKFPLKLGIYRRIIPLGLSDGFSEFSNGLVILLFNRVILAVLGEEAVVSYTIVGYVNTLVLMTMLGVTQGIQPLVSYHRGAGEPAVCHRLLRYGLVMVALCSAVSLAAAQLGAGSIVGLFLEPGNPLAAPSVHALKTYGLCFGVIGFNVILAGFFTAVERPVWALTISAGRSLVLLAGSLFLLSALFGGEGIWISPLVSESLCLIITLCFALRYVKAQKKG